MGKAHDKIHETTMISTETLNGVIQLKLRKKKKKRKEKENTHKKEIKHYNELKKNKR